MSGLLMSHWAVAYLAAALVSMAVGSLLTDRLSAGGPPSPALRGTLLVIAAAAWPLMLVGLAQLGAVRLIARAARPGGRHSAAAGTAIPVTLRD